jgi:hypothetical protein
MNVGFFLKNLALWVITSNDLLQKREDLPAFPYSLSTIRFFASLMLPISR